MSKTYETWQVMRLLSRHRDWRAEAPETDGFYKERAESRSFGVIFQVHRGTHWELVSPGERSDWRIIKPRRKRASKVVTRVSGATALRFEDGSGVARLTGLDPSKTYKLVEVGK